MRKKLSKIIFILIISLFIHPLIGYSQTELTEELIKIRREPLKGIKGIFVSIEDLSSEAKELGITKESLKTQVELKLRLAGIKVHTHKEWLENARAISWLYVNLNTVSGTNKFEWVYAYNMGIELKEMCYIERSSKRDLFITWTINNLGVYNIKEAGLEEINKALKRVTDIFLNDYLAVNPKK